MEEKSMPHHVTPRPRTYLEPSPADRPASDNNQKLLLIVRKMVIERNMMIVCVCVCVVPSCCAPAATFTTCCFVYVKATVGSAALAVSLC